MRGSLRYKSNIILLRVSIAFTAFEAMQHSTYINVTGGAHTHCEILDVFTQLI